MTFIFFYLTVFVVCFFTYLLNPLIEKKTFILPPFFTGLAYFLVLGLKGIWCLFILGLWLIPVNPLISLFNNGKRYSEIDNGIVSLLSYLLAFLITTIISFGLAFLTSGPLLKLDNKIEKFNSENKLFKIRPFASGFIIFIYGIAIFGGHWWFLPDKSAVCHRYLDGRYSNKTASGYLVSLRERVGSEFGIIDNCNKYIRLVDPDKLIINKEGFWDNFYSDK